MANAFFLVEWILVIKIYQKMLRNHAYVDVLYLGHILQSEIM